MAFWKVIILGMIQGLTEFLPVSSSGHLVLAQHFFGITNPQMFFDVMLHVGTLGAIVVVFRRDIRDILAAIVGFDSSPRMTKESGRKFAWLIVVGSVPTVVIALVFNMFVEKLFVTPLFVSGMLSATGIMLWLSGRFAPVNDPQRGLNSVSALVIGVMQGFAVLPGVSRSGATISTALVRGVGREEAARYSLLLSVPAVLGAVLLELKDVASTDISVWAVVVGTTLACGVGYAAIRVLLRTLKTGRFSSFAYYCWGIGAVSALGYVAGRYVGL